MGERQIVQYERHYQVVDAETSEYSASFNKKCDTLDDVARTVIQALREKPRRSLTVRAYDREIKR